MKEANLALENPRRSPFQIGQIGQFTWFVGKWSPVTPVTSFSPPACRNRIVGDRPFISPTRRQTRHRWIWSASARFAAPADRILAAVEEVWSRKAERKHNQKIEGEMTSYLQVYSPKLETYVAIVALGVYRF